MNKVFFSLYILFITVFVLVLNHAWGSAIHEYLHCLSGWIDSTTDCEVTFIHPAKTTNIGDVVAWTYSGNPSDHYWIKPLMWLCQIWLWLKLYDWGKRTETALRARFFSKR